MSTIFRPGYLAFGKPAIPSSKGRPSGGLLIWVRQQVGSRVIELVIDNPDIQVIRITSEHDLGCIFINVYARGQVGGKASTISILDSFLKTIKGPCNKIIAGDFNCTFEPLGLEDGNLTTDEDAVWGISSLTLAPVKKWTEAVLQLKSLTMENGLRAVNGRSKSDVQGNLTLKNGTRESRIDYFLINLEIWQRMRDMEVMKRPESDHNPLHLIIDVFPSEIRGANLVIVSSEVIMSNNSRRVKWGQVVKDEVIVHQIKRILEDSLVISAQLASN